MSQNCVKIYMIETKVVSLSSLARVTNEKGELKNEADIL